MDQPLKEPVFVHLPKETTNDLTAKLLCWGSPSGARVESSQPIAEFETSKTNFHLYAPVAGILQYQHQSGDEIPVGGFVCIISEDGKAEFPQGQPTPQTEAVSDAPQIAAVAEQIWPPKVAASTTPATQGQRFSAKARELLKQHGLDPGRFSNRGLIRAHDVLAALNPQSEAECPPAKAAKEPEPATGAVGVPCRVEQIPRAKRLEMAFLHSGARHTLPSSVTLVCRTMGLRAAAENAGVTISAVLVYEVARLLKKHPNLNAFCARDMFNFYEEANIGFAFDAGLGLKVPVVRGADQKSLQQVDLDLRELMVQYLNNELPVESLTGGTFTITDLSQEGATFFSPLINQGQSAILGVGAEFYATGQNEGWFHMILAFDHQLSNGREATRFLTELDLRLAAYEKAWHAGRAEEPYCSHCERTVSELHEFKAYLVEEIRPDGTKGRVCSLCLKGL